MTRITVIPQPRLDRLVALQQHPVPQNPQLSAQSPSWRAAHHPTHPTRAPDAPRSPDLTSAPAS